MGGGATRGLCTPAGTPARAARPPAVGAPRVPDPGCRLVPVLDVPCRWVFHWDGFPDRSDAPRHIRTTSPPFNPRPIPWVRIDSEMRNLPREDKNMQKTRMLWMLAVITVVGMSLSACGQAGVGPASADQQGDQPAAA